jgi:hypothetical protein
VATVHSNESTSALRWQDIEFGTTGDREADSSSPISVLSIGESFITAGPTRIDARRSPKNLSLVVRKSLYKSNGRQEARDTYEQKERRP